MSISFGTLWAILEDSPLMDSGEESKAAQAIRAGLNLHKEGNSPFWDDFMSLCSNTDGLSELLGVKKEAILTWPSKIREALRKVKDEEHTAKSKEEKQEVLPTGDTGAVTDKKMGPYGLKTGVL